MRKHWTDIQQTNIRRETDEQPGRIVKLHYLQGISPSKDKMSKGKGSGKGEQLSLFESNVGHHHGR